MKFPNASSILRLSALAFLLSAGAAIAQPYTSIGRPGAAVTPPGPGWAPDPSLFIYDGIAAGQMPRIPNIYQVLYNPVIPAPPGPGIMRAGTVWGISMGVMPTRISEIDGYRDVVLASDIHAQHLQIANQEMNGTGDIRFSTRDLPIQTTPTFIMGKEKERAIIKASGFVGIGQSNPQTFTWIEGPGAPNGIGRSFGAVLSVFGTGADTVDTGYVGIGINSAPGMDYSIGKLSFTNVWPLQTFFQIRTQPGTALFTMDQNGNAVYGTNSMPSSSYKLQVCGHFRAKQVDVETGSWCDFVFEKDYDLMPLDELEQHVMTKKHLPGIPTAAEVEAKGSVNLGDMSTRLLQKVEELTLYVIQLKNENDALKERMEKMESTSTVGGN